MNLKQHKSGLYIASDKTPEQEQQELEDVARKRYYDVSHVCCPKCRSEFIEQTLMGRPQSVLDPRYKDTNRATCSDCGWSGIVHDLVSIMKPCPICGRDVRWKWIPAAVKGAIVCDCGISMTHPNADKLLAGDLQKEVVELWNTRKSE